MQAMHLKAFRFLISLNLFLALTNFCFTQSPQTLADIQIVFSNNGTHTTFTLTSTQGGNVANTWVSVGLNSNTKMVCYF
jgi:hypothetical protein